MELPKIDRVEDTAATSGSLAKLEGAQSDLETCVAGFEKILGLGEPTDMAEFGVVRLRLCRANLSRTQVAREICSQLVCIVPIHVTPAICDLEQREIEHFQLISQHVQRWTSEALQRDWPAYCEATHKLLDRTRELVAAERSILLPLLRDGF
jgi:hypothetical protein